MTAPTTSSWVDDVRAKQAAVDQRNAATHGRTLGEALLDAPAVLRIRCRYDRADVRYHELEAFTEQHQRIWFDEDIHTDRAIRASLIAWAMEQFPHVDWKLDHDIRLACGHVLPATTTIGAAS